MYYLYGIGAFNEVAFVAMLKSGIDTGVYGAVAAFGASFLFARIIEGSLVGSSISAAPFRPVSASAYRRCCSARALSSRWRTSPRRWSPAVLGGGGLHHQGAINQSDSLPALPRSLDHPQRNDRLDSYRDWLAGWRTAVLHLAKPITGGAILGAMILGSIFPVAIS